MHIGLVIAGAVVISRFIMPLFIPSYPLLGILSCLILDAADQTILQLFTDFDLSSYQSYDKALDIFYLSVAMLTTLRNWENLTAVAFARSLFYFRLAGVLIFELTQLRSLLVIFPNVFEYFFIFYEVIRGYWAPRRLKTDMLTRVVILIWVVIKIPQEYWLHIARLDVTELIKTKLLGSPSNQMVGEGMAHLLMFAAVAMVIIAIVIIIRRYAEPPEHPLLLAADRLPEDIDEAWERDRRIANSWRFLDFHLIEKVLLVGLVSVIFAQMLPPMNISSARLFAGVTVFVVFNTFLGLRHARRGRPLESATVSFLLLAFINAALAFTAQHFIGRGIFSLPHRRLLFFLFLLTFIVTLYDRWRPVYEVRSQSGSAQV